MYNNKLKYKPMKKFYLLFIALVSFTAVAAQNHFQPAFEGNGYDHMNIYILESTIEGMDMQAGDEIAVFDGDVCAGVYVLNNVLDENNFGFINASKADVDTAGNYLNDGYIPGNTLSFKLWDASELTEYDNVDIAFIDNSTGLEIDPVPFTVGASVFVRLKQFCSLSLEQNIINSTSESGIKYMYVYSNTDWTVDQVPSWITVNKLSGTGDVVIRVTWTGNTGESRTGDVIFGTSCEGVSDTLTIVQEAAPCSLSLEQNIINSTSESGIKYMYVYSNTDWTVDQVPSWITVNKLSGTGDVVIRVTWTGNTGESRTGDVIFGTSCEGVSDTLTIVQEELLKSIYLAPKQFGIDDETSFIKSQVYPNPFSSNLIIEFQKEKGEKINILFYDLQGRLIYLINKGIEDGYNQLVWEAKDSHFNKVNPGVYLVKIQSDLRNETFKLVYKGE